MTTVMGNEDQKKRTLDALERRFKQAEAELHVQQNKSKKRPFEEKDHVASNTKSSSAITSLTPSSNSTTPSKTPSRKGNVSFSASTAPQDTEANNPAYFQLSHSINENLMEAGEEISDRKSTVDQVLHEFLQHGDAAQKYIQGSRSMKIDNWILLDNFVQKGGGVSGAARLRALKSHAKRSKKHMSLKQHKIIGSFDMPTEFHNFELFEPMQEMWKTYTSQLLRNVGKNQLAQCLLNADLHGAFILVVQCKIAAFNGVNGLMIRETAETFGIITKDNKFRVVPKKLSVFMLQVDCWKVTLHGDKLTSRTMGS